MVKLNHASSLAHFLIAPAIHTGDTAVDATAGNGYDTVFLCKCVGEGGRVYAFDIQEEAIARTEERLKKESCSNAALIHAGHETIGEHIKEEISAAMFNLGYLPGSGKGVTTSPEAVIKALKACFALLKPKGMVSIVFYTGHPGGLEEYRRVHAFLKSLDPKEYDVASITFENKAEDAPRLMLVQRN